MVARRNLITTGVALGLASVVVCAPAWAATVIDGPINLGTAESYGVLASTTVTSTGATVITGDLGLSPGTAVDGLLPGQVSGAFNVANADAGLARDDLTTAFGVASSLTPTTDTLYTDLVGLTLTPGVYAGGELSLSGQLTLDADGDPDAVWVFQAASTLVTAGASEILLTGGANSCNVFWRVGSSATLGGGSDFVGTIMADVAITAVTDAEVEGRLLARTAAVTLDSTTVTTPSGCADATDSAVTTSPTILVTTPPVAVLDEPYDFDIESEGSDGIEYDLVDGELPTGLELDESTGLISGTPTEEGTSTFRIAASNGTGPDDSAEFAILVEAQLAATGVESMLLGPLAFGLAAVGALMVARRPRPRHLAAAH